MVVIGVFFRLVLVAAAEHCRKWNACASELRFHAGPAEPMLTVFSILSTTCASPADIMMFFS